MKIRFLIIACVSTLMISFANISNTIAEDIVDTKDSSLVRKEVVVGDVSLEYIVDKNAALSAEKLAEIEPAAGPIQSKDFAGPRNVGDQNNNVWATKDFE